MRRIRIAVLALCLSVYAFSLSAKAAESEYTNPDTGYRVLIEDDADLLSPEEEELLGEVMQPITEYGNAAFKSVDYNSTSAKRFAESRFSDLFGSGSGTLLLIDMDNREIYIWSNGYNYRVITDSYADTITDNCYRHASNGDYYRCAEKAFTQINTLLSGSRIAQPMKWIGNVLLALALALLINYFVIRITSTGSSQKVIDLQGTQNDFELNNVKADFIKTTKTRVESSSGGSGGGGGGGSSGGGGGGGGGGGHSF